MQKTAYVCFHLSDFLEKTKLLKYSAKAGAGEGHDHKEQQEVIWVSDLFSIELCITELIVLYTNLIVNLKVSDGEIFTSYVLESLGILEKVAS
jgi:hypothetical protein